MKTCPYCEFVEKQVINNPEFQIIDIGEHIRNLHAFLELRDNNSIFDESKRIGDVGIPCYVKEDGTITLNSEDVGLEPMPDGPLCSLENKGKGC